MALNANDIRFGVELETTVGNGCRWPVGDYHRGVPVSWLPEGWKAERDSSIHTTRGRKGVEFVSPILKGESGIASVVKAVKSMNERAVKVNATCGIHVTVDFKGNAAALARLISLVARYEKGMFASTGTHSRENGMWCRPVKSGRSFAKKDSNGKSKEYENVGGRYLMLNLAHLARGRERVEFRVFSGSTNIDKIVGWIRMCVGLVEKAMDSKRAVNWDSKMCPVKYGYKPHGGAMDLDMLLHKLGWIWDKGVKIYGLVGLETYPNDGPVKVLKKMAQKYDAEARPPGLSS